MGKISVLFVCLGNICRSPAAEAIFLIAQILYIKKYHAYTKCGNSLTVLQIVFLIWALIKTVPRF